MRSTTLWVGVGVVATFLLTATTANAATGNPGERYNLSPASRTLTPTGVLRVYGKATSRGGVTTLTGAQSAVVFDFGREVGGLVSLRFNDASDAAQQIGLAFSESTTFVSRTDSDFSNGGAAGNQPDGILTASATPGTTYTMPADKIRGGFRYLTVVLNTDGWVSFDSLTLQFTAAPAMANPRAYRNYFYSNDDLLNRIWYAGAYTVQMDTISPSSGRVWPPPPSSWENDALIGPGDTILVDGAKRDRAVWAGDLGIASATAYASTGDTASTRNSLEALFSQQSANGELPMAGAPICPGNDSAAWPLHSDTYHLWALTVFAGYFTATGDRRWLTRHWSAYRKALAYSTAKIDASGLMSVTATDDWARGDQGGENIAANALLYRVLQASARLATVLGRDADAQRWDATATNLAAAVNDQLWDASAGLYRDNPGSDLYPQDGNSLAVWFGLAAEPATVVRQLTARWGPYGATTPEWGSNIATFPGSMEVHAHFVAGDDVGALNLIRRQWGYMLTNPTSTNSTFWEGFLADGSFGYAGGGSYMSNAHGWASGPTAALTEYVLGLAPDPVVDGQVIVRPHPGDLTHAEGRLGGVTVSWDRQGAALTLTLTVPPGGAAKVYVPSSKGSYQLFSAGTHTVSTP